MRRYGWSTGQQLSPFTSTLSNEGVPDVTDDDYEYITSDDLHNRNLGAQSSPFEYGVTGSRTGGSYFRPPNDDNLNDIPQEDILLLRHGNEVKEEFFPAFSIGDGKLFIEDVRDRLQLLYDLSDAQTKHIKLYYKGKVLKNDEQPICVDGVKNNSELLVVLPGEELEEKPKSPTKKGRPARPDRSPKQQAGPSSSTGNLEVPRRGRPDQKSGPSSRAHSAASGTSGVSGDSRTSNISNIVPPKTTQGSAMDQLNNIDAHFESHLLPLCKEFVQNPPSDPKKRADEHAKISETVFQHVLLKLDAVSTGGEDATRAKRKALVNKVQDVLKDVDSKIKPST
ncbi:bag domain containing protein [Sporothrix brasiliensis 5110]|uniref:Bag domain containing protein n=1 Tax=Sporothrix brasiliensis 5110 TaxID=1398154 RepID=A0A0C2FLR2_9PEZI|nr:bag domain containing protein [Sporothrix brasiliensis 5110]KIH92018.1 bag domain containing protein [Sporothrix brasiliensis 5110]